jgi:hypothetical protein
MTEPNSTKQPDEMSEVELAEYFYAHRDDLAGEEVSSRAPERMDVMISARFTPSEAAELRAAAEQARMSVSAFLRQRVMTTLHTNVVDLERARADLKDVYTKAADALRALAENPPPTRRRTRKPPRETTNAA